MTRDVFNKVAEFQNLAKTANATIGADYVGISKAEYKIVTRTYSKRAIRNKEGAIKDFKTDLLWLGTSMGIVPKDVVAILSKFPFNGKFVAEFIQIKAEFTKKEFKVRDMVTDKWFTLVAVVVEKP